MSKTVMSKQPVRRLIVDSDVAFDDVLAIAALRSLAQREIALISTVRGVSKAANGARVLQSLFPSIDQVVAGVEETEPPKDHPWVPASREGMSDLLTRNNIITDDSPLPPINQAKDAIKSLLQNSAAEETFDLICLGPLSNLAELARDDLKLLRDKIDSVWIMGGSLQCKGFNFGLDPPAAKTFVVALHDKIHLLMDEDSGPAIASDATNRSSIKKMANAGTTVWARIVREDFRMIFWDVMCAFAYTHPDSVTMNDLYLTIDDGGSVIPDDRSSISVRRLSNVPLQDHKEWISKLFYDKKCALEEEKY